MAHFYQAAWAKLYCGTQLSQISVAYKRVFFHAIHASWIGYIPAPRLHFRIQVQRKAP